jgi:ribosomal protein L37AE/L43A
LIVKRNSENPEACSNCGSQIGKLETPYIWEQHIVCEECHDKLSRAAARRGNEIPLDYAGIAQSRTPQASPHPTPVSAIRRACPVCGSTRPPIQKAKGNGCLLVVLLLLWIIPGIIYAIVCSGYIWVCPDCGAKLSDVA